MALDRPYFCCKCKLEPLFFIFYSDGRLLGHVCSKECCADILDSTNSYGLRIVRHITEAPKVDDVEVFAREFEVDTRKKLFESFVEELTD